MKRKVDKWCGPEPIRAFTQLALQAGRPRKAEADDQWIADNIDPVERAPKKGGT